MVSLFLNIVSVQIYKEFCFVLSNMSKMLIQVEWQGIQIYAATKLALHNDSGKSQAPVGGAKIYYIQLPSCHKVCRKILNIFGWHLGLGPRKD